MARDGISATAGASRGAWGWTRWLQLAIGALGVGLCAGSVWLVWTVGHSPGDDNPTVFLAYPGLVIGLWSAWGVVRALRGARLAEGKRWVVGLAAFAVLVAWFLLA